MGDLKTEVKVQYFVSLDNILFYWGLLSSDYKKARQAQMTSEAPL